MKDYICADTCDRKRFVRITLSERQKGKRLERKVSVFAMHGYRAYARGVVLRMRFIGRHFEWMR